MLFRMDMGVGKIELITERMFGKGLTMQCLDRNLPLACINTLEDWQARTDMDMGSWC